MREDSTDEEILRPEARIAGLERLLVANETAVAVTSLSC
jgi:hypothetical protein